MRRENLNRHYLLSVPRCLCSSKTIPQLAVGASLCHPARVSAKDGGGAITIEIRSVPWTELASLLQREPPDLTVGKAKLADNLADGSDVLGILAEAVLCEGQKEITCFGRWRACRAGR